MDLKEEIVAVPNSKNIKVFIQGNLDDRQGKTFFLTCHDIGTNHKSWLPFTGHPSMRDVVQKSIFLHICIPGQEDQAANLPEGYEFPSLDELAQDFSAILAHYKVKAVIGLAEGVGANVMARFTMAHPNRVLGLILIHCTSTTAGVMEYISNRFINWTLEKVGMNDTAWEYLIYHKFGINEPTSDPRAVEYLQNLRTNLNPNNLSRYLNAFLKRTDIVGDLSTRLKTDALLVVGAKASHIHTVYTMMQGMNKTCTTMLVVDDVGDVITESPQKVARALILFCKGCGVLVNLAIPGMERIRTLSASMEDADRPGKVK